MEQLIDEILIFFKSSHSEEYMFHVSQFPRDAIGLIRSFVRSLHRETIVRVYAIGGDGIVFDCLNGIMGFHNVELAIVPYGHNNDFIRGFGKQKFSLFRNMPLQYSSPTIPIDVMRCGNNYALNFCVIGTESETIIRTNVLRERLEEIGHLGRWINDRFYEELYYLGGIQAIFSKDIVRQDYEITLDGEDFSGRYRGINIANSAWYGGNNCPVSSAMPNDGEMDVLFAYTASSFRTLLRVFPYLKGRFHQYPSDFLVKRARKVTIRSESPLLINFDGIVSYDTDITIELHPGMLRFVDVTKTGYLGARINDKS